MPSEEEDDDHPDQKKLLELLAGMDFADRSYAYCAAHSQRGPEIPLTTQTAVLKETGRVFRYDKGEKFFAWRDANGPDECELGLNVSLEGAQVEWILAFSTPSGHMGGPLSGLAKLTKQRSTPAYRHSPPHPRPH